MKKFILCFFVLLLFIQSSAFSADISDIDNAMDISAEYLKPEALSSPGTSCSDWSAIALAVSGRSFDKDMYIQKLSAYVSGKYSEDTLLSANKSTEWHRIALAAMAAGEDARSFGGADLVSDGVFNRENLGRQGINAYIWALIVIEAGKFEDMEGAVNTADAIISELLSYQNIDGGFSLSARVSDPDITAMAVYALAPYRNCENVSEAVLRATDALSVMQNDDGGYSNTGEPNAESTAQVIIALSSLGIDADSDERFVKNGRSALDALLEYRTDEGFSHVLGKSTDTMATYQSLTALSAYKKRCAVYDFYAAPKEIKPAHVEAKESENKKDTEETTEEKTETVTAEIETETPSEAEALIFPSEAHSEPYKADERSSKLPLFIVLAGTVIIIAAVCVVSVRRIRYEK